MSVLQVELTSTLRRVKLSGPLNIRRAEYVTQRFRALSEQGVRRVVVDLADVPFIDSRGLAALIAGYQIFGGDAQAFQLAGVQDQPRLLFELTGHDRIFQILAQPHLPNGDRRPVAGDMSSAGERVAGVIAAGLHRQVQASRGAPAPGSSTLDWAA